MAIYILILGGHVSGRYVGWFLKAGVNPTDEAAVAALLPDLSLRMEPTEDAFKVFVNGEDVTFLIRTQEVNGAVSQIAAIKAVRDIF